MITPPQRWGDRFHRILYLFFVGQGAEVGVFEVFLPAFGTLFFLVV